MWLDGPVIWGLMRPALLVDVDGPLNPYRREAAATARGAFAWVGDEITAADRACVTGHHNGPALLHRVDPRCGLDDDDFVALTARAATGLR
ncbi:hypothetical protein CP981_02370 [Streptomyces platensis]|uniref:Uncharacterized protein n=1 Tax=Streptomyces platensis TaxID=58346 RepID=A0AAE6NEU9_STRPT|nr:hypothetical protein [Streptomyces platensis]QEV50665.1 hypothetical protein CP981_02370 [Streptomyces platensis]